MFKQNNFLLISLIAISCQSNTDVSVETYTVKRGDFVISVIETGELEAVNSKTISSPGIPWHLGSLKIAKLVEDGKQVQKDEVVAEFDKTEVQKNLDDATANLDIALAELRKAMAEQASQIEELEANLQKSELQHRISKLELEKAAFEADIEKKKIELDLEKAGISLETARQEIENKKKVHHEELSKLKLKVKQERTRVKEAEETLDKLTVKAPAPGIVILKKNWSTGEKIQVDDEVWRGQDLIGLPDLSRIQAKVEVNEVDISKIDTSQKVLTKLDAFPDTSFSGRVTDIAVLARNKERDSKVKVFDVTVLLAESDTTMMPGMTVSCEIIVDEFADTLFVPLEALFNKAGETIVYVKKGNDFKPRSVSAGAENDDYVLITEGLKEGEQVALVDPTEVQLAANSDSKKRARK